MRYVIVCVVDQEAGKFNNRLRAELWEKMQVKSSKLPAHFTIKAPFEYEGKLTELEQRLEAFCQKEKAAPFKLKGYNHFDERVIYMDVDMSEEGKMLHERLIEELEQVPYIEFNKQDGKDKVFHVTVSSKKLQPVYQEVWAYVQKYPCNFNCSFDNISIYEWRENTWQIYKTYHLAK